MGYDVTFMAPVGDDPEQWPDIEDGWRNYTSNVSRMWYEALGGTTLGDLLDPVPLAKTLIEPLNRAIAEMMEAPEHFREMNPANGWGNYEGALGYLVWIRDRCQEWPESRVRVSR